MYSQVTATHMNTGSPILIQDDCVMKSILIALACGVVLRLVPVIDDADEHLDRHVKEIVVSWVCDVRLSLKEGNNIIDKRTKQRGCRNCDTGWR